MLKQAMKPTEEQIKTWMYQEAMNKLTQAFMLLTAVRQPLMEADATQEAPSWYNSRFSDN